MIDKKILQSILYFQSQHSDPDVRNNTGNDAVSAINSTLQSMDINNITPEEKDIVTNHADELRRDGITYLGQVLSESQLKDIHSYLQDKEVCNTHVQDNAKQKTFNIKDIKKQSLPQASYTFKNIINTPHLLELVNSNKIISTSQDYLGCIPTLFHMNLMWNFVSSDKKIIRKAQNFHRDKDNLNFCILFVYLTDSDIESGAHQYIKKTHKPEYLRQKLKEYNSPTNSTIVNKILNKVKKPISEKLFYDSAQGYGCDAVPKVFKNDITTISAPRGHAFLSDVFGLHRGLPPIKNDRLLFWARFSAIDNSSLSKVIPENESFYKEFVNRIPQIKNNKTYEYINRICMGGYKDNSNL